MVMNQHKKKVEHVHGQFTYCGRWIDKKHFRAFVYDIDGNKKLANNFDEFNSLTSSGIWFESPVAAKNSLVKEVVTPVIVSEDETEVVVTHVEATESDTLVSEDLTEELVPKTSEEDELAPKDKKREREKRLFKGSVNTRK